MMISFCILFYGAIKYKEKVWLKRVIVGLSYGIFVVLYSSHWVAHTNLFPLQVIGAIVVTVIISYSVVRFNQHKSCIALFIFPAMMSFMMIVNVLISGTGGISAYGYWILYP
jgi:hypothetical protein